MPKHIRRLLAVLALLFVAGKMYFPPKSFGVIGGQELSKTAKGILTYIPGLWGREGIVWAAAVLCSSFVFLWALARLPPPWEPVQMPE